MLAVNLFHMRGGKIVDRREFFWEELPEMLGLRMKKMRRIDRVLEPRVLKLEYSSLPC